jgi:polyferredoxin
MKAWDIVAYTYDAGIHCPDCARADGMAKKGAIDSEGNDVHPVFASDYTDSDQCCEDCGETLIS